MTNTAALQNRECDLASDASLPRRMGIIPRGLGAGSFVGASRWMWDRLPQPLKATPLALSYGRFVHAIVRRRSRRGQSHGTFFFRNRAELELLRRLCRRRAIGSPLRVTVLACSNGAEVYSVVSTIRTARPDLQLTVTAIDISADVVEIAKRGRYAPDDLEFVWTPMFERLNDGDVDMLFDRTGGEFVIKPWLRESIDWQVADARDPDLAGRLGPQDIVIANRFLCHMQPADAEACLRSIAPLVRRDGYLFVSGIDLDVRTAVARDLRWIPVRELLTEIHEGDPSVRTGWPWNYWGLEPLNPRLSDWELRYAAVFVMPDQAACD